MLYISFASAQWLSLWSDSGVDLATGVEFCRSKYPSLEITCAHVTGNAGLSHRHPGVGQIALTESLQPRYHTAALYIRKICQYSCQFTVPPGIVPGIMVNWQHQVNLSTPPVTETMNIYSMWNELLFGHTHLSSSLGYTWAAALGTTENNCSGFNLIN